jgi:hypothetical protein
MKPLMARSSSATDPMANYCFEVANSPEPDHYEAKSRGWIDGAKIYWERILLLPFCL